METTFPRKRETLFTYFGIVFPYINLNSARLKVSAADILSLTTLFGDNATPDTYLFNYAKWADQSGARTKDVISDLSGNETDMKQLLTSIYEDIPASVWTNSDRNALRRKRGLPHTYTRKTVAIVANTYVHHKVIGPCNIKISCLAAEDSSRPSINRSAGANAIELAICIIAPTNPIPSDVVSGKVRLTPVTNINQCPYREIHLKASMLLVFGAEYRKCDVSIYARQYDVRHPELAGPWSEILTVTIP